MHGMPRRFLLAFIPIAIASPNAFPATPTREPPPGYRAFALSLSWEQLQFLSKGDHVDVMVTFRGEEKGSMKERVDDVSGRLLDNALVLDVSKPRSASEKGAVELALDPMEAQYLASAIHHGDIDLARRKPGDLELPPLPFATIPGPCDDWIGRDYDESDCKPKSKSASQKIERPDGNELHESYRGVVLPMPAERAALLRKGDRVDLIASFHPSDGKSGRQVSATPLQRVLVLAVSSDPSSGRAAVELELNPLEAEYLVLFSHRGSVDVARRESADREFHGMSWSRFEQWWNR